MRLISAFSRGCYSTAVNLHAGDLFHRHRCCEYLGDRKWRGSVMLERCADGASQLPTHGGKAVQPYDQEPGDYQPTQVARRAHGRVRGGYRIAAFLRLLHIELVIRPPSHRKTASSAQVAGQVELVHPAAVRANMRSILVAMMKSFSCSPLIFLVCSETVALPQPKLIFG